MRLPAELRRGATAGLQRIQIGMRNKRIAPGQLVPLRCGYLRKILDDFELVGFHVPCVDIGRRLTVEVYYRSYEQTIADDVADIGRYTGKCRGGRHVLARKHPIFADGR